MKNLILLLLCAGYLVVYGQQKSVSGMFVQFVDTTEISKTFNIVREDSVNKKGATTLTYLNHGRLIEEAHFSNYEEKIRDGKSKTWYENGNLHSEIDYAANKIHGQVLTFWEDGTPKRIDQYKDGKYIEGQCFNQQGDTIPHFDYQKMPHYSGGEKEMMRFLAEHIKYPIKTQKEKIEGRVIAKFVVTPEGKIGKIEIAKSLHPLLDKEALRVIRQMPDWEPGLLDGKPVDVYYVLPIKFQLR
ncbi:hypothetical protein FACS189413_19200 [Bacteroidia bacterium]|nr:hypothetical protein FACS189413_19200 [Bacteroidia bacterium]